MTSVSASKGQDKISFGEAVVKRLKEKGWSGEITFSVDKFSISFGPGKGAIFLDNTYSDWQAQSSDAGRQAVIDRLVQVAFETAAADDHSPTFDESRPNILPAVRDRAFIDNVWMAAGFERGDSYASVSRPLCDWLSVVLTVNNEASIATLSSKVIRDWGKSFDEVMAIAMINLKAFKTQAFELQPGGFHLLATDDSYDPSILLLPDRIAALPVKGLPVAVAVTRGCVVVAGSDDVASLRNMAVFVEDAFGKDPRAISYMPVILRNGKWEQFNPDRTAYPMIHRLRQLQFITDYNKQRNTLEEYNTKIGRDVYVGQLDAIEDGEKLITWASLVSGITTLLPVSDVVVVAPHDLKNPFVRRFGDVMTVAGELPIEPDTWPPLYVFKDGLDHRLADFLKDRYPQPPEFPNVGKPS